MMNGYTDLKQWLENTDRQRFPRWMVEKLVSEHEALRAENARLREKDAFEPVLPTVYGKQYQVQNRTQIAPQPIDIDDDTLLVFKPVPIVILKEV